MKLELPKQTLDLIEQCFPGDDLKVFLDTDWNSEQQGYRLLVRKAIVDELISMNSLESADRDILLDLTLPPTLNSVKVSISHTKKLGGWICSRSQAREWGFDLELTARATEALVKRISSHRELTSAPSPAHLWTAKEASFKALNKIEGLQTLSQIETLQWIPLHGGWWIFNVQCGGAIRGNGLSGPYNAFHMSFFRSKQNLKVPIT